MIIYKLICPIVLEIVLIFQFFDLFETVLIISQRYTKRILFPESPEDFAYIGKGVSMFVDNVDDAKTFQETCSAMTMLGITTKEQRTIWKVVAAILHLGNVEVVEDGDQCFVQVCISTDFI